MKKKLQENSRREKGLSGRPAGPSTRGGPASGGGGQRERAP
jgi:hypothetical protein